MKVCKLPKLEGVIIPERLKFKNDGDILILTMSQEGVNSIMQEDASAFEAWALLGKGRGYAKVKLEKEKNITIEKQLHYNRFLYRIMRFSELFDWFTISKELEKEIEEFRNKYFNGQTLVYNVPTDEGEEPSNLEGVMEYYFVNHTFETNRVLGLDAEQYYRQLPVGLFYDRATGENSIFTRKKSAIDFWGITKNTLNIVELKAGNKYKMGALTELLFYVCFMRDFYKEKGAKPCEETTYRGLDKLINTNIEKVRGILLVEKEHPNWKEAYDELKKASLKDERICFAENIIKYKHEELS